MDDVLQEVRESLIEDIRELTEELILVTNVNMSKVLTEEEWHKLCLTSLRGTEVMLGLAQNIFPEFEDFKGYSNNIVCNYKGIEVLIPTTTYTHISLDMHWYKKDLQKKRKLGRVKSKYEMFLEAEQRNAKWEELMDILYPQLKELSKVKKWIYWYGYLRYDINSFDKDLIEETIEMDKAKYKKENELQNELYQEQQEKLRIIFEELVPILKRFTKKIVIKRELDICSKDSLEDIAKREGFLFVEDRE